MEHKCISCKYWESSDFMSGTCEAIGLFSSKASISTHDDHPEFYTDADFGCMLFELRDGE